MNSRTITELIVNKAIALGAAAAGIANIQDLKSAPAFVMMPQRPHIDRVGAVENTNWTSGRRGGLEGRDAFRFGDRL